MSFIHYLFLGHFERDGAVVRFAKRPGESAYRPVVRRPLDTKTVRAALRDAKGTEADDLAFPDDWPVWLEDGYLACDKYTRNREAINFVAHLAERTRCDIYDVGAHRDITLDDWHAVWPTISAP
jgi:hypothetical protein